MPPGSRLVAIVAAWRATSPRSHMNAPSRSAAACGADKDQIGQDSDVRQVPQLSCRRGRLEIHSVPCDRTGHAVATATSAAEFGTADRDDLDAGLAQKRVGVGVAIVG